MRIEHIFGFDVHAGAYAAEHRHGGAVFSIGLTNLLYNLCWAAFILRQRGQVL